MTAEQPNQAEYNQHGQHQQLRPRSPRRILDGIRHFFERGSWRRSSALRRHWTMELVEVQLNQRRAYPQSAEKADALHAAPQQERGDHHRKCHRYAIGRVGGPSLIAVLLVEQGAASAVWQREKCELGDDVKAEYDDNDGGNGVQHDSSRLTFCEGANPHPSRRSRLESK